MKKVILSLLLTALLLPFGLKLTGIYPGKDSGSKATVEHVHGWAQWEKPVQCGRAYIQFHSCTNCGFSEFRAVSSIN